MIKLPCKVQKRISSVSLTSFTRAVEELVYNSIDAKATSIAVRVHIKDGFIQVVDNGHGISKMNLKYVGEPYATSKYDKTGVISAPKYYGFKGQTIASLVKISHELNITSRSQFNEDTWTKLFREGKERPIAKTNVRPSKGTTVEIKDFLYNLKIRKKTINEFHEIDKIRNFMAKISLVHHNVSLSLRDNLKNEIIFNVSKKRDVYQTLFSLCGVDKETIKELQIEKKDYKVKAFITDSVNNFKWIYLNKKFILNEKIKNILDDKFKKYSRNKKHENNKLKNNLYDDETLIKNNQLSYFIFIECPYEEYDFSLTPEQSLLEFRNWDDITNILDKLVQFYFGHLKVKKTDQINQATSNKNRVDTQKQVRNIIGRVLGSLSRKPKTSPVMNGIKGKFVTRNKNKNPRQVVNTTSVKENYEKPLISKSILRNETVNNKTTMKHVSKLSLKVKKSTMRKNNVVSKPTKIDQKQKRKKTRYDFSINKFQKEDSSVRKRCDELATKVEQLLALQKKEQQSIKVNRTVQLSSIVKNNKHYTVRKHIEEITVETTEFKNDYHKNVNHDNHTASKAIAGAYVTSHKNKLLNSTSTYDFNLKSSTEFQTYLSHQRAPIQTFESHELTYYKGYEKAPHSFQYQNSPRTFMTKESMENFYLRHLRPNQDQDFFKIQSYENREPNENHSYFNYETAIETCGTITTFKSNVNTKEVLNTYQLLGHNNISEFRRSDISKSAKTHSPMEYSGDRKSLASKIIDSKNILSDNYGSNEVKPRNAPAINMNVNGQNVLICDIIDDSDINSKNTYTVTSPFFSLGIKKCLEYPFKYPQKQYKDCEQLSNDIPKLLFSATYSVNQAEKELNLDSAKHYRDVFKDMSISEDTQFKSSNYFQKSPTVKASESVKELACQLNNLNINETYEGSLNLDLIFDKTFNYDKPEEGVVASAFQLNDRNNFVPKGMSPICYKRTTFDHLPDFTLDNVFLDQDIFNEFKTNIQSNLNIYEPHVQDVKHFSTVDVFKFKNRLQKDNDPLIFDSRSLTNAMVLGQVDEKFIAAKIKGKSHQSNNIANYLVLFDQHAVHERIRLENNLLDYLIEDQWTSVEIDSICLKISNDELIYISNYSNKFKRYGLKWKLINENEINVNGIPEAIIGKSLRSVEKVIVAVKNLILELVNLLRFQGGVIPLYPKSIMELVFSEACRYAIKFGERLSKEACVELLRDLSSCKVPFQCAHGRPVMAVLLEIEHDRQTPYTLNLQNIRKFRKKWFK